MENGILFVPGGILGRSIFQIQSETKAKYSHTGSKQMIGMISPVYKYWGLCPVSIVVFMFKITCAYEHHNCNLTSMPHLCVTH